MDYLYFLKSRTRFVRQFYLDASSPFLERRRKIDEGEAPFDQPGDAEEWEPPYLDEWLEAGEALDVLGQACISMLSSSLHLYIEEWISELVERAGTAQLEDHGIGLPPNERYRAEFKKGRINGYRVYCAQLGVDWTQGPSDLSLLEQIVLARNTVQHTDDITSVRARQSKRDFAKNPTSFFADELELAMFDRPPESLFVRPVRLDITQEKLFAAIDEVEAFCTWLNEQHPMRRT